MKLRGIYPSVKYYSKFIVYAFLLYFFTLNFALIIIEFYIFNITSLSFLNSIFLDRELLFKFITTVYKKLFILTVASII